MNDQLLATENTSLESLKGLKGVEYRKAWNKLHKSKCRKAAKQWRQKNPEKAKQLKKEFLKRNPEKKRLYRRRVMKKRAIKNGIWDSGLRNMPSIKKATMAYQLWGPVEDCMVMEHREPDRIIAEKLGRSIKSIEQRRLRLKKQNALEKP